MYLLEIPQSEALQFSTTVKTAVESAKPCSICFYLGESDPCEICSDPKREKTLLCVVEEPRDVEAMEKAGVYHGLYHVLRGALNPAHASSPEQLTVEPLLARLKKEKIREVVLATDSDFEGDGTALFVARALRPTGVAITRLSRGAPPGTSIGYLNRAILTEAMEKRRPFE